METKKWTYVYHDESLEEFINILIKNGNIIVTVVPLKYYEDGEIIEALIIYNPS